MTSKIFSEEPVIEKNNSGDAGGVFTGSFSSTGRIPAPFQKGIEARPMNGQHDLENEDEKEEDLILGDEDESTGDEEEFDVELEDDLDEDDIDEDDLVIDVDDDIDDEEDDEEDDL